MPKWPFTCHLYACVVAAASRPRRRVASRSFRFRGYGDVERNRGLTPIVENGRDNSRPDPPGFLHLTRPFPYSRKNPETGRDAGWKSAGSGRKRESSFPARFLGFPYLGGKDPDLTRILQIRVKPNNSSKGPSSPKLLTLPLLTPLSRLSSLLTAATPTPAVA